MCAPSTSASVMMMTFSYRRSSFRNWDPLPHPKASTKSVISWFAFILSEVALATFKILPRKGRTAWVLRSRACLAEPPALSPSTIKISVPSRELWVQSESFPGNRTRLVADWRLRDFSWRLFRRIMLRSITCSRSSLAVPGSPDSQWSK